jgi:ubiquinone/menaquinone biosynthesis C-methylase UbiE
LPPASRSGPTFERAWSQYSPLGGTCVEIGCGAGRVTNGLVRTFERVVGLDVSEQMITLAREAVPDAEYIQVDSTRIPLGDREADAVFTCHVLQHLETSDDVAAYLREAYRVLRPGGTAMVHLLVSGTPRPLRRRVLGEVKLRATRALNANRGAYARVRRYRPDQVRAIMEDAGFKNVELREFRLLGGTSSPHPFWLGRKP